jgi:hypothetical protein
VDQGGERLAEDELQSSFIFPLFPHHYSLFSAPPPNLFVAVVGSKSNEEEIGKGEFAQKIAFQNGSIQPAPSIDWADHEA